MSRELAAHRAHELPGQRQAPAIQRALIVQSLPMEALPPSMWQYLGICFPLCSSCTNLHSLWPICISGAAVDIPADCTIVHQAGI